MMMITSSLNQIKFRKEIKKKKKNIIKRKMLKSKWMAEKMKAKMTSKNKLWTKMKSRRRK